MKTLVNLAVRSFLTAGSRPAPVRAPYQPDQRTTKPAIVFPSDVVLSARYAAVLRAAGQLHRQRSQNGRRVWGLREADQAARHLVWLRWRVQQGQVGGARDA